MFQRRSGSQKGFAEYKRASANRYPKGFEFIRTEAPEAQQDRRGSGIEDQLSLTGSGVKSGTFGLTYWFRQEARTVSSVKGNPKDST